MNWNEENWKQIHYRVRKIQKRIALATIARDWHTVYSLQKLVYNSYYCRMMAVQRVTSNKKVRTPGIDGLFWWTDEEKYRAVRELNYRRYRPQPWKRVYVAKDHDKSKQRPLSVPIIYDRAMQALFLIAVDPVIETLADPHAFGFRLFRSSSEVIKDIVENFGLLAGNVWICQCDIKECFDHISHSWLLEHFPMNKKILKRMLSCGYMYQNKCYPTTEGLPQGGVLSPSVTTFVLSGFEKVLSEKYSTGRVKMIRFVDDFLFAADDMSLLQSVIADLSVFLIERTLTLSETKTHYSHISEGFDFIGWHMCRQSDHLMITPTNISIKEVMKRLSDLFMQGHNWTLKKMIERVNDVVVGWTNYHRYMCKIDTLVPLDNFTENLFWKWALRKYSTHDVSWVYCHLWKHNPDTGTNVVSSGEVRLKRFSDVPICVVQDLYLYENPYTSQNKFRHRLKERHYF